MKLLLIPGPVNVPTTVLKALMINPMNHRSEEFRNIVEQLIINLERLVSNSAKVSILSGSGTLAVEAMIYSLIKKGEKVVNVIQGNFGERASESCKKKGAQVIEVRFDEDEAVNAETLSERIKDKFDAIVLIQNETSKGISVKDLEAIGKFAEENNAKLLVDAVSSFGGTEIKIKEAKITALATASQKCIASVPGLSFVFINNSFLETGKFDMEDVPSYLDLGLHLRFHSKSETPFTPAVNLFNATLEATKVLLKEGLDNRIKRHKACASSIRKWLINNGLHVKGNESNYSDTVIAIDLPYAISSKIVKMMESQFNVEVAKGMGEEAENVLRIGIMGVLDRREISYGIKSLAISFKKFGLEINGDIEISEECSRPSWISLDSEI